MAEPLAGDLRMDAARQQVSRMRVPEIVQPDATQAAARYQLLPFVGQAAGLDRLAVRARHNERIRREPNAQAEQLLRLSRPMGLQLGDDGRGEGHRSRLAALGLL